MPHQLTDLQVQQINDALAAGRKVEAIKLYREFTGTGLKEAKDFIDALVPQLQQQDPARFAKAAKSGCASALLVCAAAIVIGAATAWLAS